MKEFKSEDGKKLSHLTLQNVTRARLMTGRKGGCMYRRRTSEGRISAVSPPLLASVSAVILFEIYDDLNTFTPLRIQHFGKIVERFYDCIFDEVLQ